ncbi:hypothetical protein [Peribacillus sp. SCS-155]|uniref:hypothetical protein n=1 Tax=Peribacillus sedimenti TaxID=3115297 RepID=UPI003905AA36
MKKFLLTFMIGGLLILTGCGQSSADPVQSFVSNIGTAHVEGDDVFFEYNGEYHVAKGQRSVFEKTQGESMIIISMSDGSYIIQSNNKNVANQNGYDRAANKQKEDDRLQKEEQDRQAQMQRQQQLQDEKTAYLRNKEISQQKLDQAKLDLQAEKQTTNLQMAQDLLKAQIAKINAEVEKIRSEIGQ